MITKRRERTDSPTIIRTVARVMSTLNDPWEKSQNKGEGKQIVFVRTVPEETQQSSECSGWSALVFAKRNKVDERIANHCAAATTAGIGDAATS